MGVLVLHALSKKEKVPFIITAIIIVGIRFARLEKVLNGPG
jgi:hypothetical protein